MSKKYTIEDMQELAKKEGGKCLSKIYINKRTPLRWQCEKGHEWESKPTNIIQGSWCKECFFIRRRDTIENMQQIALKKGGWCLSPEYFNSYTKLWWQCGEEGHVFSMKPGHVKRGHWCNKCYNIRTSKRLMDTIENTQRIAKERGFKCLSTEYIHGRSKLIFQCPEKHKFPMTPFSFKQGQGCPICSSGFAERVCREYFERIFKKKFPKVKPKWLVNSRGNRMHFDGFCNDLGLAFEYHGEQHFIDKKEVFKDFDLEQRKRDDKTKEELCKLQNIH